MDQRSSKTPETAIPVAIGVVGLGIYVYLLLTLRQIRISELQFTFFPVPRFTFAGELLFISLVVFLASWHIRLAVSANPEGAADSHSPSRRSKSDRLLKFFFGIGLLCMPILFRAAAIVVMNSMDR